MYCSYHFNAFSLARVRLEEEVRGEVWAVGLLSACLVFRVRVEGHSRDMSRLCIKLLRWHNNGADLGRAGLGTGRTYRIVTDDRSSPALSVCHNSRLSPGSA